MCLSQSTKIGQYILDNQWDFTTTQNHTWTVILLLSVPYIVSNFPICRSTKIGYNILDIQCDFTTTQNHTWTIILLLSVPYIVSNFPLCRSTKIGHNILDNQCDFTTTQNLYLDSHFVTECPIYCVQFSYLSIY